MYVNIITSMKVKALYLTTAIDIAQNDLEHYTSTRISLSDVTYDYCQSQMRCIIIQNG